MTKEEARQRIAALSDELEQHNYNYYILAKPTISDYEFHVKLIVVDGRFGEDVIIVVVLLQFVTQGGNTLSDFFAIHNIM